MNNEFFEFSILTTIKRRKLVCIVDMMHIQNGLDGLIYLKHVEFVVVFFQVGFFLASGGELPLALGCSSGTFYNQADLVCISQPHHRLQSGWSESISTTTITITSSTTHPPNKLILRFNKCMLVFYFTYGDHLCPPRTAYCTFSSNRESPNLRAFTFHLLFLIQEEDVPF